VLGGGVFSWGRNLKYFQGIAFGKHIYGTGDSGLDSKLGFF
jgi:hypothetical protein